MTLRRIALAGAAVLALGGCAPLTPPPDTQIVVAKGEYGFEALYNGAATLYQAAPASPQKAQARALMLKLLTCDPTGTICTGYVQVARNLADAADAQSLASEVALITSTVGQVNTLLKGH